MGMVLDRAFRYSFCSYSTRMCSLETRGSREQGTQPPSLALNRDSKMGRGEGELSSRKKRSLQGVPATFLAMFHASYLLGVGLVIQFKKKRKKLGNLNLIGGYDHSYRRKGLEAS